MMQRRGGWWAVLLLAVAVSGCETMTPNECKLANWREIGLRDGLQGETMAMLDERSGDCAKAGVRIDADQYLAGRGQGLQNYCRLDNAVPLGLSGGSYSGVCSPLVDVEFRRRHQAARAVYELRGKVNDLAGRSERVQRRLRDADRDEDKQLKAADKEDDRKRIRKDFDERRHHLRQELRDLDRGTRNARDDLRSAEFMLDHLD
jgi:hypothetical protein